ncbi:MAG TPA: ead/Ea22-like family protein [Nocardioides sp.]|nr:ead/Ea22-like family protein [Nocardioides sp.]
MTADTLRTAADRLRTLAEAATPGPWCRAGSSIETRHECSPSHDCWPVADTWSGLKADGTRQHPGVIRADAEFIAAMSPPVALALADLLDAVDRAARLAGSAADHPEARSLRAEALAVARAVLEEA